MNYYDRTYIPPIFHVSDASESQMDAMEVVFDTLRKSLIDFAVVRQEKFDEVRIQFCGEFSKSEQSEIASEVKRLYETKMRKRYENQRGRTQAE